MLILTCVIFFSLLFLFFRLRDLGHLLYCFAVWAAVGLFNGSVIYRFVDNESFGILFFSVVITTVIEDVVRLYLLFRSTYKFIINNDAQRAILVGIPIAFMEAISFALQSTGPLIKSFYAYWFIVFKFIFHFSISYFFKIANYKSNNGRIIIGFAIVVHISFNLYPALLAYFGCRIRVIDLFYRDFVLFFLICLPFARNLLKYSRLD